MKKRIVYKDSKGNKLKGVTTIINEIWTYQKQKSLMDWSAKLATEGIYHEWERDRAGSIGTLVHELVLDYLNDTLAKPESIIGKAYENFESDEAKEARRILHIYKRWIDKNLVGHIYLEHSMIDEEYQYGGTPDFIGGIENPIRPFHDTIILDWKTGFVDEISFLFQLSAYYNLVMVNHPDINIDYGLIVGLDRNKKKIVLTKYSIEEMLAGFDGFWHYLKAHLNRTKIEKMRGREKNDRSNSNQRR